MNMLITKKVDIVLQGHEHGYERSKQLKCAKVNTYDATCVANSGNSVTKSDGTIIHVIATGGQSLRSLNTSDSEYPYFAVANNDTYGFGKFTVNATSLTFQFIRSAGGSLTDQYTITDSGGTIQSTATPVPSKTPTPISTATPTPTIRPTTTIAATPTSMTTNCNVNTSGLSSVTLSSGQIASGIYTIWSRIMSGGSTSNAYYLQIDSICPILVGDSNSIPVNIWEWINYKDGNPANIISVSLNAGTHTFKLFGKETGTKIDQLLLTIDPSCIPTGTGTNCSGVTPVQKSGDANGDGSVNGADFVTWLNHYGQNLTGATVGDFNNSGKVDGSDFVIWLNNYGK
jgi:hypothetical protein